MAVYLDSSALVKLVIAEAESAALRRFLRRHPQRAASALVRVEVVRAVRFQGRTAADRARKVLARIPMLRIDDAVLDAASALDPRILRSLDAIHLASAQEVVDRTGYLITYDRRMSAAAALLGVRVRSPGAPGDRTRRRKRQARAGTAPL